MRSDIKLRLYRSNGLHGEIRMGDARVDLDEVGTFLLSDAVDRIVGRMERRTPPALRLNGRIVPVKEAERAVIEHALTFDMDMESIASELGIASRTLFSRRQEYGLPIREKA